MNMEIREKIEIIVCSAITMAYVLLLIDIIHLPILMFIVFAFLFAPFVLVISREEIEDYKYGIVRYETNPYLKQNSNQAS